jgi:tRNA dimethylallyltransferase
VPIICGGTGYYIDAIVNGTTFPEVAPNKKLREELEKKTTEKLFETLKKLDEKRAENIDKNNRVRLIRAIEIAKALGQVPKQSATNFTMVKNVALPTDLACNKFEVLKIGLTLPPEILKERIRIRLFARIRDGMLREIKKLHENGVSWKRMEAFGLEYKYCALYLQSKLPKSEMIEQLNTKIWQFAKRQKTWFKRDKSIIWLNPLKKSEKNRISKKIKSFLK